MDRYVWVSDRVDRLEYAAPRERLKQAAERLFADHGFHRLSLRQLASEVGMLPGSLYAHFDGKDSLLQELIEDGYEALVEGARTELHHAPHGGALEALVRHHLRFRRDHPCWFALATGERRHLAAQRQAEIIRYEGEYEHLFVHALGAGAARGVHAGVRQLLRLLDALSLHDEAHEAAQLNGWARDLAWLAVRQLAAGQVTVPGTGKHGAERMGTRG
ncbi:TetR family transcriptional regulator [Stutzerimonas stutzeri]|uniref:TetR family transcriptional regulator n=1 Tax=Stutzerimonas stutzeri TaxID=316 RepID=A0A6I6LKK7_STUST|nr:TetR family transcriptional regulator [Stutzerimonas stutzeri]